MQHGVLTGMFGTNWEEYAAAVKWLLLQELPDVDPAHCQVYRIKQDQEGEPLRLCFKLFTSTCWILRDIRHSQGQRCFGKSGS